MCEVLPTHAARHAVAQAFLREEKATQKDYFGQGPILRLRILARSTSMVSMK